MEKQKNRISCECTVKVRINNQNIVSTAKGNGPVNAFDNALIKALEKKYPALRKVRLVGYKVREINVERGTAAKVQVCIEFKADKMNWTTEGVSTNILKASEEALVDGYNYYLNSQSEF